MDERTIAEIKNLWKECFHDSDDYLNRFFCYNQPQESALYIEQDHHVVSSLQMLPYTLYYYGYELPVTYIYAVCTAPAYRRRGYMRQLLQACFEKAKQNGSTMAMLLPANKPLFESYRKCGFVNFFCTEPVVVRFPDAGLSPFVREVRADEFTAVVNYLQSCYKHYPMALFHSEKQLRFVEEDLLAQGVRPFVYLKNKKIVGTIWAVDGDEQVTVVEIQADTEAIHEALLKHVAHHWKKEKVWFRRVPQENSQPLSMCCLLNAEPYYPIWLEQHPHDAASWEEIHRFPPSEQVSILFDLQHPKGYMSLMLDL